MNLDELMRRCLRDVAEKAPAPEPDVSALQRRGRRTRLTQVAGATTAVAALIVGGGVIAAELHDQPSSAPAHPDTTATSPSPIAGSPPVWRSQSGVRVGGEYLVAQGHVKTGPTLVEAGVVYTDESDEVFVQTLDGKTSNIGEGATLGAVGDPRGSVAAWFDQSGQVPALVVYDTASQEVLARKNLGVDDVEESGDRPSGTSPIIAITEGAVYYRGVADALMRFRWADDDYPAVFARKDQIIDVAGDVTARMDTVDVLFTRPDGSYFRPGPSFFRIDGTPFRAEEPLQPRGSLSSDGRYFLGYVEGVPVVVDTGTRQSVSFRGGDRGTPVAAAWSYGSTLMVLVSPGRGVPIDGTPELLMMACAVEADRCRVVDHFPGSRPGPVGD